MATVLHDSSAKPDRDHLTSSAVFSLFEWSILFGHCLQEILDCS